MVVSLEGAKEFNPPFKRLNQTETIECLTHGWTGRATFVKPAQPPTTGGKYARMLYSASNKKSFVRALVFPHGGHKYRMVDYAIIKALEKKGVIKLNFVSECDAVFQLEEAPQ